MKVSYYKTHADLLAKTFCSLAEKCYYSDMKTYVLTASEEYVQNLDQVLWTYSKKHFIPHATASDPYTDIQPILIATSIEYQNNPEILFTVNSNLSEIESCLDKANIKNTNSIKKLIILEDNVAGVGVDQITKIINTKKEIWQSFEKFQQTEKGSWEKL